jgi:hypothetical protein
MLCRTQAPVETVKKQQKFLQSTENVRTMGMRYGSNAEKVKRSATARDRRF